MTPITADMLQRVRDQREDLLRQETAMHLKYFEPFDKLLERKAEYYLAKVEETGKEQPFLLREIEILERFRQYVAILETVAQGQADRAFQAAAAAAFWQDENDRLLEHFGQAMKLAEYLKRELEQLKKRLQECNPPSTK